MNKTVRLRANKATNLQCMVGKDSQPDDEIVDNIITIHQAAVKNLPNESQNIKSVALKLTMGKPVNL
ncbi:TPA: hypothetical protein HA278_06620 [Candidatus Woesearchaeota archaeon]|nr:hypothetical protein [Candidatus Woesearchaeota archaeon]